MSIFNLFFLVISRALPLSLVLFLTVTLTSLSSSATQFSNPLFSNGADPWLQFYDGNYYLTTTTWTSQLVMRKSPTLAGLASATPVNIWSDTNSERCCNFWAFEFHRLNGPQGYRWYVIYTAGISADLGGQKNRILESEGDDPLGPYTYKGTPMSDTWNIDGSYLQHNGNLYFLWSEFSGDLQVNWISLMSDPWTVTGSKVIISSPEFDWERQGGNVNEAPEIIQHNGRTFMTYSASSCNTQYYKLGLLELTGSDPLQASSWTKSNSPVFQQANGVYGPGHNGFFSSPDGTEDWLVYHGNSSSSQGCGDTRSVRAQPFSWSSNGLPNFASPVASGTLLNAPSGEDGPLTTQVQGAGMQIINRNSNLCLALVNDQSSSGTSVVQRDCSASSSQWVVDPTADGYYRLVNKNSGQFLGSDACNTADGADVTQQAWLSSACQQWQINSDGDGWLQLLNRNSVKALDITNCSTTDGANVQQWAALNNACQQWRLQPTNLVAISSAQSGKVVEVAGCSSANASQIQQWEWLDTPCQKWSFEHTDSAYYQLKPSHNTASCLVGENTNATVGGNIIQGDCASSQNQWRIEPLADGSLRFVSRNSDLVLDLNYCLLDNGTGFNQYTWLNNTCQRFYLRDVN